MFENIGKKDGRENRITHKEETAKERNRRAAERFRKKRKMETFSFPIEFSEFLAYKANSGFARRTKNSIIMEWLEKSPAMDEFKKWKKEKSGQHSEKHS